MGVQTVMQPGLFFEDLVSKVHKLLVKRKYNMSTSELLLNVISCIPNCLFLLFNKCTYSLIVKSYRLHFQRRPVSSCPPLIRLTHLMSLCCSLPHHHHTIALDFYLCLELLLSPTVEIQRQLFAFTEIALGQSCPFRLLTKTRRDCLNFESPVAANQTLLFKKRR